MTDLQEVTSLKGWPEVGKTYLVPTIWVGRGWYPVHPNPHTDDETPVPHYHCDARFISEEMEAQLEADWPGFLANYPGDASKPYTDSKLPLGLRYALMMGLANDDGHYRTKLLPLKCRYSTVPWDMVERDRYWIAKKYLPNAPRDGSLKAIRSADGRPLCPHQKFDLTCVWDGKSTHVRCPLHGLEIDVTNCLALEA